MSAVPGFRSVLIAGTIALVAWPLVFDAPYELRIFTLGGIYALLVLGYQFIFGRAGALALTQGAFFGLGAYITGILGARYGWTFPATFPLSILAPVALAALIAIPVLRLESHFFALATLGIAQILLLLCLAAEPFTGGANGISGVPGIIVAGYTVGRGLPTVVVVWSIVTLGALLAWQAMRGLYGQAFHIMRVSETAAQSIGIDTGRLRFTAFLLSAGYAGAAGALFVHTLRVVSPEVLEFNVMVACLAMAVVGGRTRISGAIIGALLLVHLPEWARVLEAYYLIAYGVLLLVMIVLVPDGLMGALERTWSRIAPPAKPLPPMPVPLAVRVQATKLMVTPVSKRFGGVQALSDVALTVGSGEILGLIGPNGSGKTTLINIITGVTAPDSGNIRFGGLDLTSASAYTVARRGIARTFQNVLLVPDMTVLDNVAVARVAPEQIGLRAALAETGGDTRLGRARGHAMHLLKTLGLEDAAMQLAGGLPLAIQRRVEIARALATEPRLLLLDEPAAGLSEAEQADLAARLRSLNDTGLSLLIVEHNLPFLNGLAERLVCLDGGRVIAEGLPDFVCRDRRVREAYLGRSAE